ncbi:putative hexose transporter [Filobasidium floriforme]|uniref:putative hexose transporter n=1 Tax=Filobasidium floriforme TaxID=5210 RepID=UPI001E8DE10E|nr:putative hexose transporter [Filobasidium floriforme]KAH8081882.1 putative hexose transporter [Filobasidium floriforme]
MQALDEEIKQPYVNEKPEFDHVETLKPTTGKDAPVQMTLHSASQDLNTLQALRSFWKPSLIALALAFAAAADGYQVGLKRHWLIANIYEGFIQTMSTETDAAGAPIISAPVLAAITSVISAGQILGFLQIPFVSDRFGRKWAMYLMLLYLAISLFCQSFASDWKLWLVGKLFGGIGVGCLQLVAPTYIAEIAPIRLRGALIASYSIWFAIGQLFAPVALNQLGKQDPYEWKIPVYTQWGTLGLMILLILFFVPESPWWAATQGKHELGRKLLLRINGDVKNYVIDVEYDILIRTVQLEAEHSRQAKALGATAIFRGSNLRRTLAAGWALFTTQLLGLAFLYTYVVLFFQLAGQTDVFRTTIITSCVSIAGALVAILALDKLGRYWLINGMLSFAAIVLLIIGLVGTIGEIDTARANGLIFLACMWFFAMSFNSAAAYTMLAEVPSAELRSRTAAFGSMTASLIGLVFTVVTPYMINPNQANWGLKTCYFFFGLSAPMVIGGWFIIPETARLSPAELDELYESGSPVWRFSKTITRAQGTTTDEAHPSVDVDQ